jgi:hypothetical protein
VQVVTSGGPAVDSQQSHLAVLAHLSISETTVLPFILTKWFQGTVINVWRQYAQSYF